jgi:hypothetical protein
MSDDLRALVQRLREASAYPGPDNAAGAVLCRNSLDAIESLLARAEAAERGADELQRDAGRLGAALVGAEAECARLRQDAENCVCKGNWRTILSECESLIGNTFTRRDDGTIWHFFGLVDGGDDYYYGMSKLGGGGLALLSCVGSLEAHGYEPVIAEGKYE